MPLTLSLLGRYLALVYEGDIRQRAGGFPGGR